MLANPDPYFYAKLFLHMGIQQTIQPLLITGSSNTQTKHENEDKKKLRSSYTGLAKPPKFIYPYRTHRLFSDIFLQEEEGKIYFGLNSINIAKIVSSVSLNKTNGIIELKLEENVNYPFTPVEYIIQRFKSLDYPEAHAWADTLQKYFANYAKFSSELPSKTTTNSLNEKNESSKNRSVSSKANLEFTKDKQYFQKKILMTNSICVEYTVNNKNGPIMSTITLSPGFIKMLRYTPDDLIQLILKNGIPSFFPLYNQERSEKQQQLMKRDLNNNNRKNNSVELNCELFDANENIVPVQEELEVIFTQDKEKCMKYNTLLSFRPKTGRNGKRKPPVETPIIILNKDHANQEANTNQELKEFFSKNYEHSYKDKKRVCLIKEVSNVLEFDSNNNDTSCNVIPNIDSL